MITGIFGNLSSGKTALAVYLSHEEFLKNNKKIISTLKLNFKSIYISTETLVDITIIERQKKYFFDSILLADEIHNIVDARRSSSDLNQKFTQFITQLGKLDCNLVFTSQILKSQIDTRLRDLCDVYIFCERYMLIKNKLYEATFEPRIIYDKNNQLVPIRIYCNMIIKIQGGKSYKNLEFMFDPSQVYDLYETRKIIILDRDKYLKK